MKTFRMKTLRTKKRKDRVNHNNSSNHEDGDEDGDEDEDDMRLQL